MLLPKGEGTVLSTPTTRESEVSEGKSLAELGSRAREKPPYPEPEETERGKPSKPEPFKFEFNT